MYLVEGLLPPVKLGVGGGRLEVFIDVDRPMNSLGMRDCDPDVKGLASVAGV